MSSDSDLARELAEGAGRMLLVVRAQETDGPTLKRRGDAESHEWLMAQLKERAPEDAVLSEEGKDDRGRVDAARVWIVDPVDGTREYSEPPRDDWAVHVALWERGADGTGELTAGAVALPARDVVYDTGQPPVVPARSGPIRLAVSRSRPPEFVTALAEKLDAVLVPMGSAGVKGMAVVTGEADAYVHAGGQFEWDSAAPVVVARAAGLHTSRIDGSPLEYNREDPKLPDLVIAHPDVAEEVLAAIGTLQQG
ncbi:3'(2'),5'-bisphosphate nucleotidase CysQ [Segeticoccus rhizosphaerae]|uniref:3'(2'),5'-bisphosphate nucleotidase CysQ n=3 Tax=Segeticoccus rhizosphaerae TaxID=1104777 RepID=UPI001EE423D7|nr:3'(2'),5'-bisphosphate nucleotidase CysQ [Ornithinicoccus soli]